MIVMICVDNHYGMLFGERRQSQDRIIRQDILSMSRGKRLFMNAYSKKQFTEEADNINVSESFLEEAQDGDFCFVENVDITPFVQKIEKLILYYWGRIYPADKYLTLDMSKWQLLESKEFQGYSHDYILREICVKRNR